MSFFQPQAKIETTTISLRIQKPLLDRLDAFCITQASDRTYVLNQFIAKALDLSEKAKEPAQNNRGKAAKTGA